MPQAKPLALVLEDDPGAGEALALVLRDWGAEVALAGNGGALAERLGDRLAEARWIITDFHLEGGADGVNAALQIIAHAPAARVLVLTGSVSGAVERAADAAGFAAMRKPVPANDILAWLSQT
jgi:two-component system, sensor histidine kinase